MLVVSTPAASQNEEELSARRFALEQASQAQTAGRHQEALDLAQQAGQIRMTPSLRYFIARELSALGRRAEAIVSAQNCVLESGPTSGITGQATINASCTQLVNELRIQLASFVLRPPSGVPREQLQVAVAGRTINPRLLGLPIFVDPGEVVVRATASGRVPFEHTFRTQPSETITVTLEMPEARVAPPPPPPAVARPSLAGPAVLWAVGGASLIAGGALLGVRASAVGACPRAAGTVVGVCPNMDAVLLANQRGTFGIAGGVAAGVGVAAVVGGLVWWALRPATTVQAGVTASLEGVTISVGGSL